MLLWMQIEVYFCKDAHDGLFYYGYQWKVIFVRTLMNGHFCKDAHGGLF